MVEGFVEARALVRCREWVCRRKRGGNLLAPSAVSIEEEQICSRSISSTRGNGGVVARLLFEEEMVKPTSKAPARNYAAHFGVVVVAHSLFGRLSQKPAERIISFAQCPTSFTGQPPTT
jgi:hypothetical protein